VAIITNEKVGIKSIEYAIIYCNLGFVYQKLNSYELAIKYLNISVKIC